MSNETMKSYTNDKSLPGDWDSICELCGRCCYEKYDYRGKIFYSKVPCPYLDTRTKLCRVYPQRFTVHAACTQITPEIAAAGILPEDCPYTRMYADKSSQKK